jgi:hypothetical protein
LQRRARLRAGGAPGEQRAADQDFGEGKVIIRSALRSVD